MDRLRNKEYVLKMFW